MNEWVVACNDANGERQLLFTDTRNQALKLFDECMYPIGVMTTAFYNHYIEKVIDE